MISIDVELNKKTAKNDLASWRPKIRLGGLHIGYVCPQPDCRFLNRSEFESAKDILDSADDLVQKLVNRAKISSIQQSCQLTQQIAQELTLAGFSGNINGDWSLITVVQKHVESKEIQIERADGQVQDVALLVEALTIPLPFAIAFPPALPVVGLGAAHTDKFELAGSLLQCPIEQFSKSWK